MIGLMYQKGLMLIRQVDQKNVIFVIIGNFLDKGFRFEPYVCNGRHYLMQKGMSLMTLLLSMLTEMITECVFGI